MNLVDFDKVGVFGLPFAVGGFIYSIATMFKQSQPLKTAILESLTKKNPENTIHRQFFILRNSIFGRTIFSYKRQVVIIISFLFLFCTIYISDCCVANDVKKNSFFWAAFKLYTMGYFMFWQKLPLLSIVMLLIG